MNLLLATNLTRSVGEKLLFENITFGIDLGQKVALIARNGTGKTTLLNILAGIDSPDSGQVTKRNDIHISFLRQNPPIPKGITVSEYLFASDTPIANTVRVYESALEKLHTDHSLEAQKELDKAMAMMEAHQAWDFENKAREVLGKLGINDLHQPTDVLSGGQRKKVALAAMLLSDADLLILDEPTNHLDIEMTSWLEDYLNRSKLSLLVVTHDRYFLDAVCNEIIELEDKTIYRHRGNYAKYLENRELRLANEAAWRESAMNVYRRELEWMRRMPQARATKAKYREDAFFELESQLQVSSQKKDTEFSVSMQRLGRKIMEVEHLSKSFTTKTILKDFSYIFKRGERIGLLGPNGAGKTTLLKLLIGKIPADSGSVEMGETLVPGYFEQDGLLPPSDKRIIDLVKEIAEEVKMENGSMGAPQFLNHFGFAYEMQYAPYSLLSGGERRKLSLLLTLMQNPNFLILDEPTNDLDIQTLNLLEDFLLQFPGCVLVVSHDRYFLDKVAEHLFVLDGQGNIKDFPGNYSAYTEWVKKEEQAEKEKSKIASPKEVLKASKSISDKPKATYKQKKEFEELSAAIPVLEKKKMEIESILSSEQNSYATELNKLLEEYALVQAQLEEKEMRWLELDELIT